MIAIPNMEKPKSCDECRIKRAEFDGLYDEPITGCRQKMGKKHTLREEFDALILDCPLIDIVTCGECKYYGESEFIKGDMVCKYHMGHTYYTEPDRFCSYGERRSDGDI